MKIAICDDCLKDIEYLKKLIQNSKICPFNVEFAEFTSGEELLSCYSNFDAIFLDMQMGGMDGKETAQEIRKRDAFVILSFYSLFTESAHNITDFHPFKYILKDWDEKKLMSDIEQVLKEIVFKNRITQIKIQHYNTIRNINLLDVLYISIKGKGSSVWITEEKAKELKEAQKVSKEWMLKSSRSLKSYYQELKDSGFAYASNSYIINFENIIGRTAADIILKGGTKLSLTRGMKKPFEKENARYLDSRFKETRG